MSFRYNENPFLFVNSTGSSIPQGRNVRAAARVQQAAQQAPARSQQGQFAVLDFALEQNHGKEDTKNGRKRRRKVTELRNGATIHLQRLPVARANATPPRSLKTSATAPPSLPETINPSEVLALATFHIRRLAAMAVQIQPNRLIEVLRCRQWSCMSITLDRVGQDPCLDSALVCVASKLGQITCGKALPYPVLSTYNDALQHLQSALQDPEKHNHSDLVTSTQLLAVFEMLDSLDNTAWAKHVAGAESLSLSKLRTPSFAKGQTGDCLSETAAMFADALLTGNDLFFKSGDWKLAIVAMKQHSKLSEQNSAMLSTLLEVPQLLIEVNDAKRDGWIVSFAMKHSLLDRAGSFRDDLRTGLLASDLHSRSNGGGSPAYDKLGVCLAALVALDQIVKDLGPVRPRHHRSIEDETTELCAQLLQLELGAADAYPYTDVMTAFHWSNFGKEGSFVIVLPGRSED